MATIKTKFWTFDQNNSGGSFDFDEARGITHYVIIEAVDKAHAVKRAEAAGIYFNGCDTGQDCPCCGDRWYEPWDDEAASQPTVFGCDVRTNGGYVNRGGGWMKEGKEVCVHPLDGPLEWYGVVEPTKEAA